MPLSAMSIRGEVRNHCFGMVRNGGTRAHQGWDLYAKVGTPVYAVSKGKIFHVGYHADYGNYITLSFTHNDVPYYAFYAHLSKITKGVGNGALVNEGDLIGYTGRTGNASKIPIAESHLHFEIRTIPNPGKGLTGRIDPAALFGEFSACSV